MPEDQAYLERVAALQLDGVEWTRERIRETRDLLAPWTHNVALPHGVYTAECDDYYPAHREIMGLVAEHLGGDFRGRRVMDVGCHDGYFSIECALQGAEVVGIDGKILNIRKCEFLKRVLGIEGATFVVGDAMNLPSTLGRFDAVLALGLLYHLDDPHAFLQRVASLVDGFVVLDTHISLADQPESLKFGWRPEISEMRTFAFGGKPYEGRLFREFPSGTSRGTKELSPSASLDNELSVWLTEESLVQMLHDVGFARTEKVVFPPRAGTWWSDLRRDCRVLVVASSPRRRFQSKVFPGC